MNSNVSLNLHCTSRKAAYEVTYPRLLFATHRYSPSSARLTFVIINSLLSTPKLVLESPLALMINPSLAHNIVGTGFPLALQDKVMFCPLVFVTFCGCFVILAATAEAETLGETLAETLAETLSEVDTKTIAEVEAETLRETLAESHADADTLAETLGKVEAETLPEIETETLGETLAEGDGHAVADTLAETLGEVEFETLAEVEAKTLGEALAEADADAHTLAETLNEV